MSSRKILIVGDAAVEAANLEALLCEAGYTPIYAPAGPEAIERARTERPDLILIDIVVPPVDGYETCRDLQADVAVRHIPVIAVSTRSRQADQLWARLQGASNLVAKPCSPAQLVGAIRNALI
jgi:twitching motility two-component system response regulator PilH